ncbi:MAG: hypothetical protein GF400_05525, partial [Candidatus Eisenbacteria bacterium]|nr:hypothetical protein [Candidatus Eisenbacteria bacterium]
VIITNDELAPYFQDLADWKTQKGVPAVVKTVSWINSNYPGGCDTPERIRLFIRDAYTSWGTSYVLLGGDTNIVPVRFAYTTYYGGEMIPSDLYYSDLDGNWNGDGDDLFGEAYRGETVPGDSLDLYPDVFVGRAPVRNVVNVEAFLQKTEAYEKTPVERFTDRNLYLAEVLFPYDWEGGPYSLDGASDIAEPALSYVPGSIHNVRLYQNQDEFPTSYALSAPASLDSLEMGYNIAVHVGHGNKNVIRAGKDSYVSMESVSQLGNGVDRSGFVWLLDCTTTAIDYDCIAERFMNNPGGGSVALFGPTRYAFPATSRSYYWDWLDLLYNNGNVQTGPLCAGTKALHASYEESGVDNTDRWTQLCTVLLGDPELALWTGRPQTMSVAHPASIQVGDAGMTVTVTDPSPVDSALVCVQKDDVYARGTTDGAGQLTLDFVPHSAGTLTLTVSAPGHTPYEATVDVSDPPGPHVYLDGSVVDDDSGGSSDGNSNGLAEAGEVVELDITAVNSGVTMATSVTATLSTTDSYVVLEDSTEVLGDIGPGSSYSGDAAFRFAAMVDAPNEHDAEFTIQFSEGAREVWCESFSVRIYRPELRQARVVLDDSGGNGNGVPEPGETVDVDVQLLNEGNGDAVAVTGRLRYPGATVTVIDSTASWGDVPAGATVTGSDGFTFSVSGAMSEHFRLLVSDDRGNSWSSYLDFTRPAGPDTLNGSVEGTTINLSWEPVSDPDLRGYDVYRSLNLAGPYHLANDAVVEGAAYYSDPDLNEETLYHYYVVAVDSSGNTSESSLVLSISTNPPSQIGWPLGTQSAMYASATCADVDGDEELDIVVGSEQIYVWHGDGSELMDGDGDPRTNGIFEVDSQGGFRSSPAVGEVDGDTGVEIVGAAWGNAGTAEDPAYEVYVWNADDGSVLAGWPVTTEKFCWSSPTLADLDHDGRCEILLVSADGNLYCWRYNGSEYVDGDGDPLTLGVFAEIGSMWNYTSPAVADLDGDRDLEIIQPSRSESVYVYHSDGSRMDGWPFPVDAISTMSPAVGDVDQDGEPEIALGSNASKVWLVESDGTPMAGWPKSLPQTGDFCPSPALADITGDGYLELVLVGQDGTVTIMDYLGNTLSGWPQTLADVTLSSP